MNFYLTGIEGMPKLLDCCDGNPMPYFKKSTYSEAFQRMYQEHLQTFEAIEQGYNTVIDQETFITNMAEALVSYAVEQISSCATRNKRERKQMDLNLTMAVFVFPMILEFKGNSSNPLTEKLLEGWKREFPKNPLQAADYAYIEKGFHKKFCYITTAVCETFGKGDACYELNLLRDYRDTYLASRPDGEQLIHEYYDVAPSIVKHINQREDAGQIYQEIWERFLSPCISMIESNQEEACCDLYRDMVYTLRDKYFMQ